ncbi:MAG: endonuclease III [Alphaproteobacteria bacterium]|nr:endonuclease III [Alphaproteobacteria bacterium]
MKKENIILFFDTLQKQNPDPKTELYYKNPFTLLIAVVLSAQATDLGVNKATKLLFEHVETPEDIINLGVENLSNYLKSLNYYKTKTKNVVALSRILIEKHQGLVPENREDLEALPGVGRKTANVILNTAFNQPTIAVDTHIFRVSNRTGLSIGKTPLAVELGLTQKIPQEYLHDAHHWLILLGRYICKARKPECPKCPVRSFCDYPDKTI